MRITKKAVIETVSHLIDINGLSNCSMKTVADALGIRTPSLYMGIKQKYNK